jgi:hypothetical protein
MKDKFLNSIDNNVNLSRFLRFLVNIFICIISIQERKKEKKVILNFFFLSFFLI